MSGHLLDFGLSHNSVYINSRNSVRHYKVDEKGSYRIHQIRTSLASKRSRCALQEGHRAWRVNPAMLAWHIWNSVRYILQSRTKRATNKQATSYLRCAN